VQPRIFSPIDANIVPQERLAVFRKSCQNP